MDAYVIKEEILSKLNIALAAIDQRQSAEYNEQVSCVVCNLAQAYSCLKGRGQDE
ncbi:hypothetical protein [Diplocloster modestus]|uniref:Uncharacterized protein n=1 Tax=Diplocloster modestus TaxID=2850322 RepID=A0ABS6KC19_9FIRM|nr:hypothetical protein [Diplocloster modestus]MBU9728058.1 hypothetical protein [Diplocloster modestus]